MKENLENTIKQSLQDYEVPFDPAAWTALSQKLDHVMPTNPKSNLKWYLGGAAAVAIIVTTVALWPESSENKETKAAVHTSENTSSTDNKSVANSNDKVDNVAVNTNVVDRNEQNKIDNKIIKTNPANGSNSNENSISNIPDLFNPFSKLEGNGNGNSNGEGNGTGEPNVVIFTPENKVIVMPLVSEICLGEMKTIQNTNDINLIIKDPNGDNIFLKAKKSTEFHALTEGKYTIGYLQDGEYISKETFNVLGAPKADFITINEQNKYENGIPTVDLSATTSGASYTWKFEKQSGTESGKDVKVHYFNKGEYDITLTVNGVNGCSASETKTIRIDEDYNLLANNAIDLNSSDRLVNTFMPRALTLRSVDFRMIIIDPTNGAIVFETTDATNPWTGIDKNNGQVVKSQTYIWKVMIKNPVKGENPEYKGTIIRL